MGTTHSSSRLLNTRHWRRRSAGVGVVLGIGALIAGLDRAHSDELCAPVALRYQPTNGGMLTIRVCAILPIGTVAVRYELALRATVIQPIAAQR